MKILLDARMYGLEHSGIGRYIMNLTDGLKKIGGSYQFVILLRKKYFDILNFPGNWQKVIADYGHYSFSEQLFLTPIIQRHKPDLTHFPHFDIPLGFAGKFVVTIHDITMFTQNSSATTLPLPFYYMKRIPFKMVFKKALKSSIKIITPSQSVKDDLTNNFSVEESKIAVIYEGVSINNTQKIGRGSDMETLAKYGLTTGTYFFYVGNAYPHKNLTLVLKVLKKQKEKGVKNGIFAVAGSRDIFVKRLETEARKYGVSDKVKLLGYVPDDDLRAIYRNSIAFLYPSLTEGFGLQGLEAISAGSLLLASKIPVFKEIYDKWAVYFDPTSPDSLHEAMEWVKNIPIADKRRFIESSQEFIKKYSWDKMARETFEVYNRILSDKK
jgi:glycosyltransferase involved in cell wall biosynthesis